MRHRIRRLLSACLLLALALPGLVTDDAPWIIVDHGKQVIVHRKRVQNFKLDPNFDLVLTRVELQ